MNKLHRYKDYSPDEISKMNERVNLDVVYEIRGTDNNGDEYMPRHEEDDANYNPYDLKEMVKLLIKKRQNGYDHYHTGLYIVKVTTEKVPQETLEKIRLEIEAEKYNM